MRVVVLSYPDVTPANVAALRAAADARGVAMEQWQAHDITVWCDGATSVPLYRDEAVVPDVILHRTVARLTGVVGPALGLWAGLGTVVLNDPCRAVAARDKLATAMALAAAGVPTVPSLGFFPAASLSLRALGEGAVVLKPAHGLQGRGVAFYPDPEAARQAQAWASPDGAGEGAAACERAGEGAAACERAGEGAAACDVVSEHWVAQPVLGPPGRDIRAFVVAGECLGLVRRHARAEGERRANLALGAAATALPPDHPAARLAVEATQALGLDYAGVDILEWPAPGPGGRPGGRPAGRLAVLEVDAWAGFAGVAQATGADIAGAIIDLAQSRCPPPSR